MVRSLWQEQTWTCLWFTEILTANIKSYKLG